MTINDLFWDYSSGRVNHNCDGTAVSKMSPLRAFIWSFPPKPVAEYSKCDYYINYEKVNKTFAYRANSVNQKDLDLFYLFSIAALIEVRVQCRVTSTKVNHQILEIKLELSGWVWQEKYFLTEQKRKSKEASSEM